MVTQHARLGATVRTARKPESTDAARYCRSGEGCETRRIVCQAAVPVGVDDAGGGGHARGVLTACGRRLGAIFDARPPAETVRSPAWALLGQTVG